MTERLILGACFIGVCTWAISWAIGRWADKEVARHQDELARSERFRKLSPEPQQLDALKVELLRSL
ncbi:MAG: hypothetical protein RL042_1957 [Nitrospirota bacterium]|jgi:hypothetical protein